VALLPARQRRGGRQRRTRSREARKSRMVFTSNQPMSARQLVALLVRFKRGFFVSRALNMDFSWAAAGWPFGVVVSGDRRHVRFDFGPALTAKRNNPLHRKWSNAKNRRSRLLMQCAVLGPCGLTARSDPPVIMTPSVRSSWCLLRPPCALRSFWYLLDLRSRSPRVSFGALGVSWVPQQHRHSAVVV
jgi:hypothetical protein